MKCLQKKKIGYHQRYIFVLLGLFFSIQIHAQEIQVIKAKQLFQMLEQCGDNNRIEVFNFWATWCAPCIREIPQFEALLKAKELVHVTLISLDDVDVLNCRVKKFVLDNELKSNVVLLDETDFNKIIPKVDENWSGAIPATIIKDCRNGNKSFYEKEFKANELTEEINKLINNP